MSMSRLFPEMCALDFSRDLCRIILREIGVCVCRCPLIELGTRQEEENTVFIAGHTSGERSGWDWTPESLACAPVSVRLSWFSDRTICWPNERERKKIVWPNEDIDAEILIYENERICWSNESPLKMLHTTHNTLLFFVQDAHVSLLYDHNLSELRQRARERTKLWDLLLIS